MAIKCLLCGSGQIIPDGKYNCSCGNSFPESEIDSFEICLKCGSDDMCFQSAVKCLNCNATYSF